ncbi:MULTISPECIES: NUDIX hydrolase [unclassified Agromyces]|uniref:NUDIX hydrolase n=1 Tax=unclassified Agromyces TaxID=2639701 RepID=UPI0030141DD5
MDASAATVVLLRDGASGVEVLLAERPSDRGSFAGAWVFPGGAVDEADAGEDPIDSEPAARRAAVRETFEEVGLGLEPAELVGFALWSPPEGVPKRMRTRFFAARAPEGEPVLAADELVSAAWMRPEEALERHAAGDLTLYPPTWVTLHGLIGAASVDSVLSTLREAGEQSYVGRFGDDRRVLYWREDAAFVDDAAEGGPRHRLVMHGLPWVYERSS